MLSGLSVSQQALLLSSKTMAELKREEILVLSLAGDICPWAQASGTHSAWKGFITQPREFLKALKVPENPTVPQSFKSSSKPSKLLKTLKDLKNPERS